MKVFVVIGHQNPGSFCHAIAAAAIVELEKAGHEVAIWA
jgi:putative NADPH-quinone reductase